MKSQGKYICIFLVIFATLIGCNKIASSGKFTIYQKLDDSTFYILTNNKDDKSYTLDKGLAIDLESLEDLGEFLVDKNKVFYKYDISDNTRIFELPNCDRKTFRTFKNSCYARDKNNIYVSRHGKIAGADVATFKPVEINNTPYGKDKNAYYFWDKIAIDTLGFAALSKQKVAPK